MSNDKAKEAAGKAAAQLVRDRMIVGLGTGSTAFHFINALIERCRQGLQITAVASSKKSTEQALQGGIPLVDINAIESIDLTVDGADEIDPQKRMIKGGGGALLREKILATASREMVVVIDAAKQVQQLGKCPLPVEIVSFGHVLTLRKLKNSGYEGVLRRHPDNTLYITDNGNLIADIHFKETRKDPEKDHSVIRNIPGVIETGFFFHLAKRVYIGHPDGHVEIR